MTLQLDCTCCLPRMASPAGKSSETQIGSRETSAGRGLWAPAKGCPVLTPFEVSGCGWEALATSKASFIELEMLASLKCHDTAAGGRPTDVHQCPRAVRWPLGMDSCRACPRTCVVEVLAQPIPAARTPSSAAALPCDQLWDPELPWGSPPGGQREGVHLLPVGRGQGLSSCMEGACALPETGSQGHQFEKQLDQIHQI